MSLRSFPEIIRCLSDPLHERGSSHEPIRRDLRSVLCSPYRGIQFSGSSICVDATKPGFGREASTEVCLIEVVGLCTGDRAGESLWVVDEGNVGILFRYEELVFGWARSFHFRRKDRRVVFALEHGEADSAVNLYPCPLF